MNASLGNAPEKTVGAMSQFFLRMLTKATALDRGQGHQWSSTDPVTCLFCQHINPAGARFCNSCAAQLSLQPCLHCDAADNRTATRCYKCGKPLPLHEMPESNAETGPGALDAVQTSLALGHTMVGPSKEVLFPRDLTPGSPVLERSYETNGSHIVTAVAVSRSGRLLSRTAFLLVLLAVSAYLYSQYFGKNIPTAETQSRVRAESRAPATSAMAPQLDVAVRPTPPADTPRPSAVGANGVGNVFASAPRGAGTTLLVPSSSQYTAVVTRQVPLPRNECVPAVSTLGLCNTEAREEKP